MNRWKRLVCPVTQYQDTRVNSVEPESRLVKSLTGLFGLFAGLATLVYIGGGGIVALRLFLERLPSPLPIAGRLPRELLVSVGLANLLVPTSLSSLPTWGDASQFSPPCRTVPRGITPPTHSE